MPKALWPDLIPALLSTFEEIAEAISVMDACIQYLDIPRQLRPAYALPVKLVYSPHESRNILMGYTSDGARAFAVQRKCSPNFLTQSRFISSLAEACRENDTDPTDEKMKAVAAMYLHNKVSEVIQTYERFDRDEANAASCQSAQPMPWLTSCARSPRATRGLTEQTANSQHAPARPVLRHPARPVPRIRGHLPPHRARTAVQPARPAA